MSEDKTKTKRKRADALFGQIALRLNIITKEQLQEALELQRFAEDKKPLGLILINARMNRSDHDVETGKQFVAVIKRSVRLDVHLGAGEQPQSRRLTQLPNGIVVGEQHVGC